MDEIYRALLEDDIDEVADDGRDPLFERRHRSGQELGGRPLFQPRARGRADDPRSGVGDLDGAASAHGRGQDIHPAEPADLAEHDEDWFDNADQLRSTLNELEALAVTILERDRRSRS